MSSTGFLGSQERGTETFTHNTCHIKVRAFVRCLDSTSPSTESDYGKAIDGDGYSYYTCSITQDEISTLPQYYDGKHWITYENSH